MRIKTKYGGGMAIKVTASSGRSGAISEKGGNTRVRLAERDFIFAQCSIVSSVEVEPNSYRITPETAKYVNHNGDAWTNAALRANYESFIGGYNYVNHVQEPDKSVGFLADALLRRIPIGDKGSFVYYVDILVATHRDHSDLVNKILLNQIQFLSMGCLANKVCCTKCGYESQDEFDNCDCIANSKGKTYIDKAGKRRIIAELLGSSEKGSCEFIEASWLTERPAFGGAVKRNLLQIPRGSSILLEMPNESFEKDAVQKYLEGGSSIRNYF